MIQTRKRSALRIKLGTAYFCAKRRLQWCFGKTKFASPSALQLKYIHFTNQSPLLRNLIGIDPYLEQNKITNLRIALSRINNTVLYPGETFSFWKLVGKPSQKRGFVEGVVLLKDGFGSGIGGGLCHITGLIYWATLHTPLTITERHRHSFDTTPTKFFGSDATCFYNYKDLVIRNNTNQPFQLQAAIDDTTIKASWVSDRLPQYKYEMYEKQSTITNEKWGGQTRHNIVHRKIFNLEGAQIADEFVAENHALVMYSDLKPESFPS